MKSSKILTLGVILHVLVSLVGCLPMIDDSTHKPNIVGLEALDPDSFSQYQDATKLTVLQFNIWQEGTIVEGGFDAIVSEIIRTRADLVALSEVRNYNNQRFDQKLVTALTELTQEKWYSFESEDTGLVSRYPISNTRQPYPVENDHGSISKAVVALPGGVDVAFYSAHLDYKNCAYYEPRGYDGNTWAPIIPQRNVKKLREMNLASKRDDAIKDFLADAALERAEGRPVILAGDFNEPSWRDWIEENKDLYEHKGVVYKWDVSVMLEDAGYIDSWREIHPDPIEAPGFTYPSSNNDVPISKLTWAPRSDERERIDYIYYNGDDQRLKLEDVMILGPDSSIAYSQEVRESGAGKILLPEGVWPTDHKALISIFSIQ